MCFIMSTVQSSSLILALSYLYRWDRHRTNGEPPLGVRAYACSSIGHDIFYFAGHCGHGTCRHNSLNILSVNDFIWRKLFPTSDTTGPMKKDACGMLTFHNQLLAVGGVGVSLPNDPPQSATYINSGGYIYTNEHHFYDTEGG